MRLIATLARRLPTREDADAGFTLVEVLAAVVVFVVISAATVTLLIQALGTIDDNNERVLAANVARSQVEYLRTIGADNITPGLTYDQPPGTPPGYVVETSAQWIGVGQTVSSCDAASPGQAYLRVSVAASSPALDGPAVVDTIITPNTVGNFEGTAAIAIRVIDQFGRPVSGVSVSSLDLFAPQNSFSLVTGADGCLYVPGLQAGGDIDITATKSGYVPPTPTGNQGSSSLDVGALAKPTFLLAPAAGIEWGSNLSDFPLAGNTPVVWQVNETGAVLEDGDVSTPVVGQWPTTSGFTAWAGCTESDPELYSSTRASFDFVAGGVALAVLEARPVRISGLPEGTSVIATYLGGCTIPELVVGVANANGAIRAGLANGRWSFRATAESLSETIALSQPLAPPEVGKDDSITEVEFTLAKQLRPEPTPSPSSTESPSQDPNRIRN
ncbi:MAG: carboxypeptidase-like regulatory domain-containing protein [Actinomycetes bacterium]|nr:carboxypeptidase-like regulatory domain-containing protein [Candidatus Nanopelagicales bacterium]